MEDRIKSLQSDLDEKRQKLQELTRARAELNEKKKRDAGFQSPVMPPNRSFSPPLGSNISQITQWLQAEEAQRKEREDQKVQKRESQENILAPKLTVSRHIVYDIPPAWQERYTKEIQTDVTAIAIQNALQAQEAAVTAIYEASHEDPMSPTFTFSLTSPLNVPNIPSSPKADGTTSVPSGFSASLDDEKAVESETKPQPVVLTPSSVRRICNSSDFSDFLTRTSLIMERALNANFDVAAVEIGESVGARNDIHLRSSSQGELLNTKQVFFDEKWSRGKSVTSISFNPKSSEFFLASYYSRQDGHNKPGVGVGVPSGAGNASSPMSQKYGNSCVLVWSSHLPQRAAYVYSCQGEIANAFYCKYRPNVIIGSTYSGQVVMWDTRMGSDPIAHSPLCTETHTRPVFGLRLVGNSNSHNILSVSTEGRVCVWSLDNNLSHPVESFELFQMVDVLAGENRVKREVSPYCAAVPDQQDSNRFFVGNEDGALYSVNRHGSASHISERYEGHTAPITSVQCHPCNSGSSTSGSGGVGDFSDLVLTSSMDWTCKLWSQKSARPLYSFDEYRTCVYDACWSPIHPSLFASVDGKGCVMLWMLSSSLETYAARAEVTSGLEGGWGGALNKLEFSRDGHSVMAGDTKGYLYSCDIANELAVPKAEDADRFQMKLRELFQF